MSQSNLLKHQGSGSQSSVSQKRMRITVPHFDNTKLIEAYAKTLIGLCMNLQMQDMKALLYMLPRIWKMEDRVAGADLGLGRFQSDFDREEDIKEVMKMEPFHFDYWMLSLVRLSPIVDPSYPSQIKFWVRVIGVPLHFWADLTFRTIGKGIGDVKAVNLDEGKIQVVIDGFKPLCFETLVEFHSGEETTVYLRYERLFGFCRICLSLCHDQQKCPTNAVFGEQKSGEDRFDDPQQGTGGASYKTAVTYGSKGTKDAGKNGSYGVSSYNQYKGKRKNYEAKEEEKSNHAEEGNTQRKGRMEWRYNEGYNRSYKASGYVPTGERNATQAASSSMPGTEKPAEVVQEIADTKKSSHADAIEDSLEDGEVVKQMEKEMTDGGGKPNKMVRKSLMFEDETLVEHEAMVNTLRDQREGVTADMTGAADMINELMTDADIEVPNLGLMDNILEMEGTQMQELFLDMELEASQQMLSDEHFLVEKGERGEVGKESTEIKACETEKVVEGDKEVMAEAKKAEGKKKILKKTTNQLVGGSKKRLVQALVSPRKKHVGKNINRKGEGATTTAFKGPSLPSMEQKPTSEVVDEST
ncbi:uncharacterized protein LOC112085413 [Eutrema salsugineum]|uniref:uncharacterized protein LOC112085413 n=1 Tax=Eutrema salsugineum TaxID=72664 RepID=UPI000CED1E35|nr:uncharacterized protein LOC112085413 [Eutrema salsugineum]